MDDVTWTECGIHVWGTGLEVTVTTPLTVLEHLTLKQRAMNSMLGYMRAQRTEFGNSGPNPEATGSTVSEVVMQIGNISIDERQEEESMAGRSAHFMQAGAQENLQTNVLPDPQYGE